MISGPPRGTRVVAASQPLPRPGGVARMGGGALVALLAVTGIVAVFATDQVLPATSTHQAQLRIWLGARAAGFTALVILAVQVAMGLVLSHPTNKATWRLSRLLFPWHEHAWVFTVAFVAVHIVAVASDRFANVGWLGTFVPGLSEYRSVPVALGTMAMYALLITGLTARFTRLLPAGMWLKLHRFGLGILALAWAHGLLAGTDSPVAGALYGATFALVALAAAHRYWIVRAARPTFAEVIAKESGS